MVDNNKQDKSNQIETVIAQTKQRSKLDCNLGTRLADNTLGKENQSTLDNIININTFSCEEFHEEQEPIHDRIERL